MSSKRVDIKAILADPKKRRDMVVGSIIATQAREGVHTTREQAEAAYDKVHAEKVAERVVRAEKKALKSTIANAKRMLDQLHGGGNSWACFKHALMDALGVPRDQYIKWDVPIEWQYAYRRATGWTDAQTRRKLQLLPGPDFKLKPNATVLPREGKKDVNS